MEHKGTVRLQTGHLILRPFCRSDARAIFENWLSDPEVTKYLSFRAYRTQKMAQDVLEGWCSHYTPKTYLWAVVLRESGEAVGSVGISRIREEMGEGELSYALSRRYWGRGYIPEALNRVFAYWFEEVGGSAILGMHDIRNRNSGRVMEKLGMKKQGILSGIYRDNLGHPCEIQLWKISDKEWKNRNK